MHQSMFSLRGGSRGYAGGFDILPYFHVKFSVIVQGPNAAVK